jgi:hypothetical protein
MICVGHVYVMYASYGAVHLSAAAQPAAGTSGDAGAAGGCEAWDAAVQHLRTSVFFGVERRNVDKMACFWP